MAKIPKLINGVPLLVGGVPSVNPDCCCGCPKTTCHDDYGGEKIIMQVVFTVDFPEKLYSYVYPINPNTWELTGEVRRTTRFDWRQFNGSYIVNRAAHPDCGWTFPSQSYDIDWIEESFFGSCPDPSQSGTVIRSGTDTASVQWPTGSPLNHQIKISGTFVPDPFYPCNQSPISFTNQGCGDPEISGSTADILVTGTATSYE